MTPPPQPDPAITDLVDDLRSTAHRLEAGGAAYDTDGNQSFHGPVEAASANPDDGLTGTIWASGTHVVYMNGRPTKIHVPEETIQPTFQDLQSKLSGAGDNPKIGFDHPDDASIAAQTPLGEIGEMQDVALSQDGEQIVLKDSEFTNNKAIEAAEAGAFDGYQFSIVGNLIPETTGDGEYATQDDGAIKIEATWIDRVDVVEDGAVDRAQINRVPELAAAQAAGELAAACPEQSAEGLVQSLRAAAGSTASDSHSNMGNSNSDPTGFPTNPEDLEAAKASLNQAADVVEEKDEQIEELEAEKADLQESQSALEEIADLHGIEASDGGVDPQAVIDAHTQDLREEIAELEAAHPKYEVGDTEERAEELAGKPVAELEAMNGRRWREVSKAENVKAEKAGAIAAGEDVEAGEAGSGGGSTDDQTEEIADAVLTPVEAMEADQADMPPSEKVEAEYGVDPSEFSSEEGLNQAIRETVQAENGGEN